MKYISSSIQSAAARWFLAIAWSSLLALLLLQGEAEPVLDLGIPRGENTPVRELIFSTLHLLGFALTCVLWFWALKVKFKPKTGLLLACAIAIALGASTEILQSYTPDRHASWLDLIANFSGSLIAARLIWRQFVRSA